MNPIKPTFKQKDPSKYRYASLIRLNDDAASRPAREAKQEAYNTHLGASKHRIHISKYIALFVCRIGLAGMLRHVQDLLLGAVVVSTPRDPKTDPCRNVDTPAVRKAPIRGQGSGEYVGSISRSS